MMSRIACAVIGSGLQGTRLAMAASEDRATVVKYVVSQSAQSAAGLARRVGASVVPFSVVLEDPEVDAVVIGTPVDSHAELAVSALGAGKHVLCEKPLTTCESSAERVIRTAERTGRTLVCGFNHRYQPAFVAVRRALGDEPVLELRIVYGLAGRDGDAASWRRARHHVGGGHLMEQGLHAVDLALVLMPDLRRVTAVSQQAVIGSQHGFLEDSATVLMRTSSGAAATVHSSMLQWINLFRLEVVTATQYLRMDGLGPAYGEQSLTRVRRQETGPFSSETTYYRGADQSWGAQWAGFCQAVRSGQTGDVTGSLRSLATVMRAYDAADTERWRDIPH